MSNSRVNHTDEQRLKRALTANGFFAQMDRVQSSESLRLLMAREDWLKAELEQLRAQVSENEFKLRRQAVDEALHRHTNSLARPSKP